MVYNRHQITMRNKRTFIQVITIVFLLVAAIVPQQTNAKEKKTVYVTPETAKIYYNGQEVGNGSYTIVFGRDEDFVVLKFEAPGYISRTVKLFKNNPKKTISYELYADEAFNGSMGSDEGVDLANKFFSVTCKKGMTEDIAWKRLMNIAVTNFENVEVRDKAAGWIKTGWVNTTFTYQIVRTRLEIQVQFTEENELSYRVKISSEIADKDCGTSNQCFSKYDRILRKYESVISELQTSLGSNF